MSRASRSEHYRREVSRVEGFSDAVFAFAITLLVVSLEVPKTFEELMAAIRGFPAFAVCFALLFQVWWRHYRFFRNYDLEDGPVIALTGQVTKTSAALPAFGVLLMAIILNVLIAFIALRSATPISRFLKESGMRVFTRIIGLILAAIAVQFIITGIRDAFHLSA